MENGKLEPNLILVNWVNATDTPVNISWSGAPNTIELNPFEPSPIYAAALSELNVLSIEIQNSTSTLTNPNLLFTGLVQCAEMIYQQRTQGAHWMPVDYLRHLTQSHYSITLLLDNDGLVIVGTVELVEPIPVPTH
jgi:hypothetical protein